MVRYIHERSDWPGFTWNTAELADALAETRYRQGLLLGKMSAFGFDLQREANLEALTASTVHSSAIEGETLDYRQVRSSIAHGLGMKDELAFTPDRHVDGIVAMTLDATTNCAAPLTRERLFGWHAGLFPTGYSGLRKISVAVWRSEASDPMQVVSGSGPRERIHFEAPAASRIPREIGAFLRWFEAPNDTDPMLRAGIAHLYFITLHPFQDGNGRIARAIADMCLARAERDTRDGECAGRFYSVSSAIERNRSAYYDILESTQRGTMDVTRWLIWFVTCVREAIDTTDGLIKNVMRKNRVWAEVDRHRIGDRQRVVLSRLLDGFEGKLTSGKYAKLAKCSQDTALRDINELIGFGILEREEGGGRSTAYRLVN